MTGKLLAATALVAVACATGGVAAASAAGSGERVVLLSNETTFSRWAYPNYRAIVYRRPRASSHRLVRLHPYTESGWPEVYLVLRRWSDASGQKWIQIRLPMRPNGLVGWVKRGALGPFHSVVTELHVDRRIFRATLYRRGRPIWSSPIGVGRPGIGTPAGHFWVTEKLTSYASPFYGPIAFGTSAYSRLSEWPRGGVIGIHGTDQPYLIPGRISHGCVRVPDSALLRLAPLLPLGTPVRIT
jgi:hypothetical protein